MCGQNWSKEPSGSAGPLERDVVGEAIVMIRQGEFVVQYLEPHFWNPLHCGVLGQSGPRSFACIWKVAVKQQPFLSEGDYGHPWWQMDTWVPVSAGLFSTISSSYYWLGSLTKSDPRTLVLTHKSSSTIDYLHGSPFQALFSGWLSSASWTSLSVPACPPVSSGLVSSNFFDFLTPLSRPSLSQLLPHLHML